MLDLHYWPTPNGKKVTILLEELELDYNLVPCRIGAGDQFTDDFLKISPNNRMPALVDHAPAGGEVVGDRAHVGQKFADVVPFRIDRSASCR